MNHERTRVVKLDETGNPVLRIGRRMFSYCGRNDDEENCGSKEKPHTFLHTLQSGQSTLLRNYLDGVPSSFSFSDEEFAEFIKAGQALPKNSETKKEKRQRIEAHHLARQLGFSGVRRCPASWGTWYYVFKGRFRPTIRGSIAEVLEQLRELAREACIWVPSHDTRPIDAPSPRSDANQDIPKRGAR